MSSIGTGYDLGTDTFSPDGRIFQVEYANKAVENCGTALGVCCVDGVVVGVEKTLESPMMEKKTNVRTYAVDKHAGICSTGLNADARQVAARARSECADYLNYWGISIEGKTLSERIALFMHAYTCYWSTRPFGASILCASYGDDGPQLHMIDPAGSCWGYHGCAIGKGRGIAKSELEKLPLGEVKSEDAVKTIVDILYETRDESKEKILELELYWVTEGTNKQFVPVPEEIVAAAEEAAQKKREEADD